DQPALEPASGRVVPVHEGARINAWAYRSLRQRRPNRWVVVAVDCADYATEQPQHPLAILSREPFFLSPQKGTRERVRVARLEFGECVVQLWTRILGKRREHAHDVQSRQPRLRSKLSPPVQHRLGCRDTGTSIDQQHRLAVHPNVARISEESEQAREMLLPIVLVTVLLRHENFAVTAVPRTRPRLIRPGETEREIGFTSFEQ